MEKKNQYIFAVSIVIIVILLGIFLINNNNIGNKSSDPGIEKKGDRNNLTESKKIDDLEVNDIVINKTETNITIIASINNVTDKDYPATSLNFVLLDGDGKVIKKIPISISKIKVGEKENITVDVTGYYGDSRDFRLEKR